MNKLNSKKIISIGLSTLLGMGIVFTPTVYAAESRQEVSIYINGKKTEYPVMPYLQKGVTMVPMRSIFEQLGAEVDWDANTKTVHAMKEYQDISLTIGSKEAIINNVSKELLEAPIVKEGATMVPLRFVGEGLGADVMWLEDTKSVYIDLPEEQEEVAQNRIVLTYEQALEKVTNVNSNLKNKRYSVEKAEEVFDRASLAVGSMRSSGQGQGLDDLQTNIAMQGHLGSEISLKVAKKELEVTEEQIAYDVWSMFFTILESEHEYKLTEKQLAHDELSLKVAELKLANGLESQYNVNQLKNDIEQSKQKMQILDKSIGTHYLKLNEMLGNVSSERYNLKIDSSWELMMNFDFDFHIRKMKAEDPYLFMQEKGIEAKQLGLDLYVYNANQDPYRVKEIDLMQAKLDLSSAKSRYDQVMQSRYNQLQQLEEQYQIVELNQQKLEESYKLLQAQYKLGMVTELQLQEVKLGLDKIQFEMYKLENQYYTLKRVIEKPYIAPEYMKA